MSQGVEVALDDGVATIVFLDKALRHGRGVAILLDAADHPDQVQWVTHPEYAYVVPEDVARRAGFLHDDHLHVALTDPSAPPSDSPADDQATANPDTTDSPADTPPLPGDTVSPPADTPADPPKGPKADDGKPDAHWLRPAIDAYAKDTLGIDVAGLPNKPAALKAIRDEESRLKAIRDAEASKDA